ncbi:hypothetical protein quinque_002325 [Culex quinquefasciatus]
MEDSHDSALSGWSLVDTDCARWTSWGYHWRATGSSGISESRIPAFCSKNYGVLDVLRDVISVEDVRSTIGSVSKVDCDYAAVKFPPLTTAGSGDNSAQFEHR